MVNKRRLNITEQVKKAERSGKIGGKTSYSAAKVSATIDAEFKYTESAYVHTYILELCSIQGFVFNLINLELAYYKAAESIRKVGLKGVLRIVKGTKRKKQQKGILSKAGFCRSKQYHQEALVRIRTTVVCTRKKISASKNVS